MYSLSEFSLADMTRCGAELRKMGKNASSMEQVADKIIRYHMTTSSKRTPEHGASVWSGYSRPILTKTWTRN